MRHVSCLILVGSLLSVAATGHAADKWKTAKSDKYGFTMQVPKGTLLAGKEWKGGWGGLRGAFWDTHFHGIAQLGKQHARGAIELFGMIVTGVPGKHWKLVDKGRNKKGFTWYRAVKARKGNRLALGIYGVNKRGSYLVVLTTSPRTYRKHKAAFDRWYRSVKVF